MTQESLGEVIRNINFIKSWPQGPLGHTLKIAGLARQWERNAVEARMWLVENPVGGQWHMYALQISSHSLANETPYSLAVFFGEMNFKFITTKLSEYNLFLSWGLPVIYGLF